MGITPLPPLSIPPEVIEIVGRLRDLGFPTFVVGGGLRDALLKRESRDWDVATGASCERVVQTFPRVIPIGIRHGTVTVRVRQQMVEVSAFRGDGISEDLRRRDFTINALAYDPFESRLIDPFGGIRDLKAQRVRAVEDPVARFREDPLRIVRAIRIASELGFRIHRETWRGLHRVAGELASVAPERIREEFTRSMMTVAPAKALRRMRQSGILRVVIPELMEGHRVAHTTAIRQCSVLEHALRTMDYLPPKRYLRWAGLLHEVGKPRARKKLKGKWRFLGHRAFSARMAGEILERLRFSRKESQKIVHLIRHQDLGYTARWPDAAVRRLIGKVGLCWADDLLALCRADKVASGLGAAELSELEELAARVQEILPTQGGMMGPRSALTGRDVMEILDTPPCPSVGKIMTALHRRVTEKPESNTREDLTRWLLDRYIPAALPELKGIYLEGIS